MHLEPVPYNDGSPGNHGRLGRPIEGPKRPMIPRIMGPLCPSGGGGL